jgi:tetratricopeptide (TPR) repeat protein
MEQDSKQTLEKKSKVKRIVRYSVTVIAVALLIFVCVEVYSFYRLSSDRLFAEGYTAYATTTTHDENDSTGSKIEKAYWQENYEAVIKLNANSVLSVNDIFLTGMSYLKTNDLARAISNFQVVIADVREEKKSELKEAAEYYLSLAYLKNNDYDQAIELMNKIHDNSSHRYKEKFSRKYINKVKRLKWR